jgi:hypothetical protein
MIKEEDGIHACQFAETSPLTMSYLFHLYPGFKELSPSQCYVLFYFFKCYVLKASRLLNQSTTYAHYLTCMGFSFAPFVPAVIQSSLFACKLGILPSGIFFSAPCAGRITE